MKLKTLLHEVKNLFLAVFGVSQLSSAQMQRLTPQNHGSTSKVKSPQVSHSAAKLSNAHSDKVPASPYDWTIEQVIQFLSANNPALEAYRDIFKKQVKC